MSPPKLLFSFLALALLCCCSAESDPAGDAAALLVLKAAVDPSDSLPWRRGAEAGMCAGWKGVKECTRDGRVTKLVLEVLNLTGVLHPGLLPPLDQLRVLSFKANALSGPVPDLSPLVNLKSLYLADNRFSGRIPASLASLHRLKIVVLSDNLLSGPVPDSLTSLPRLYSLLLQNNRLSGKIPAFDQPSLRFFNVSGNDISGEVPATNALAQFNGSSFLGNPGLCGEQLGRPCSKKPIFPPPPMSQGPAASSSLVFSPPPSPLPSKKNRKRRVIAIVAGSVGGFLCLVVLALILIAVLARRRRRRKGGEGQSRGIAPAGRGGVQEEEGGGTSGTGGGGGKGGALSWEGEGQGRLVFVGGAGEMYGMEELLRASAETLGRGSVGSTYKAVMESGYIVTVKRLRDGAGAEEFRARAEAVGALRHPNLVALRAYFQAKEERLLVYDYFPNGSLFSLIHGSRPSGSGKPLHWTSCLKIAEDVAAGLLYLHQTSPETLHGNLKSSNVLLGPDFESCLTDYGLVPAFLPADPLDDPGRAASLFYRAPESRPPSKAFTQQSDIYSFGVLLLELLTGKTPFQDLVEEHGADIPQWVRVVREEETESGDEPTSGNEASEEKLSALLSIAMACVALAPESRPETKDVLKMVREARAEALVSSNSSDHSPGRWSGTVQSLPREYGSEHSERD